MTALLTDNIALLAGAPNGIKKLRELILELAVRGKLVSQDPNDEPASELLKRIAEEKAQLVTEGKIKKQKSMAAIAEDEKPYHLPDGWEWVRLPEVYYPVSVSGNRLMSSQISEEGVFPVVDQGKKFVAGYTDDESLLIRLPGPVVVFGDHTTERKYVDFDFVAGADGVKILRPVLLDEKFFWWHLVGLKLEGRGYARHFKVLNDAFFALPPKSEQSRIVAKVDNLMALCNRLEAQQADAESAHAQLVQVLLDSLTQASGATDFAANWQRLAEDFHILFTTEPSIDSLKQTLLQIAVMGKLVPQDPSDEPASELLRRIAEERESCVAGRRSAKHTALPSTDETEKTFELPSGWEWVRLQQIISVSSGDGLVSANMRAEGGIPVYGGNGVTGYHDEKNIDKATLVIGRVGYYCGSIHLTPASAWITDNALIVNFSEENLCKNFLFWLLKGTNLKEQENATAQPVISGRKIYPIVLAIPPLAEQRRIASKVDQLMSLCDQLKTHLTKARQLNEQLASTLAEQAVA